jgi:CRISPR system Cascade subunit CasC
MNTKKNPYKNMRVEYHILQSFPVSCLNRDDVGAPKTAVVGGVTRARVSSQCWKRQVRLALHDAGVELGTRTKLIEKLVGNACLELGASQTQANACGEKIKRIFIKGSDKKGKKAETSEEDETEADSSEKTDTLLFLSPDEVKTIALAFQNAEFVPDAVIKEKEAKKQAPELVKLLGYDSVRSKKRLATMEHIDGLDIALFGRMAAQAPELNVEAAASFSHAISTHKATNEVEFFTALDDYSDDPGSAHMGSLEFNSATYYRYISLDMGLLYETLGGDAYFRPALDAFTKALYVAVPSARQTTQAAMGAWEYAKVFVRRGQGLQASFEKPARMEAGGGYLEPSKKDLNNFFDKKKKDAGSLFGMIKEFDFGEGAMSIDDLASGIQNAVAENAVAEAAER